MGGTSSIRLGDAAPSLRAYRKHKGAPKPPAAGALRQYDAALHYLEHALGQLGGAVRRVDERHPEGAALAARVDAAEILIARAMRRLRC